MSSQVRTKNKSMTKTRRHKKRQSRTEVSSDSESSSENEGTRDGSDNDDEGSHALETKRNREIVPHEDGAKKRKKQKTGTNAPSQPSLEHDQSTETTIGSSTTISNIKSAPNPKPLPKEILQVKKPTATASKFQTFYLQRITTEFADDLDTLRKSEDFNNGALEMLRRVLGQGVEGWDESEMERVVGLVGSD